MKYITKEEAEQKAIKNKHLEGQRWQHKKTSVIEKIISVKAFSILNVWNAYVFFIPKYEGQVDILSTDFHTIEDLQEKYIEFK